ncbi:DUF397 domain-containing protein [Streptomyces sp. NRRL F-5630]|uniref:DUF397 domain-containing protein n=1 Tax=Streptomyces sp. NRRL F-5630 TaxID=1463864 RepID=UPI0004CA830C|nr:DUF397 domain-containing protein [Streptomyces sp. NRRL F-5630]
MECSADLLGSGLVPVRDSKLPHGPVLTVTPAAWAGLVHLLPHGPVLTVTPAAWAGLVHLAKRSATR